MFSRWKQSFFNRKHFTQLNDAGPPHQGQYAYYVKQHGAGLAQGFQTRLTQRCKLVLAHCQDYGGVLAGCGHDGQASAERVPYQMFAASLWHKFVTGHLVSQR